MVHSRWPEGNDGAILIGTRQWRTLLIASRRILVWLFAARKFLQVQTWVLMGGMEFHTGIETEALIRA